MYDSGYDELQLPADCAQHGPSLTAWFDGEATTAEAAAARAHLEACFRCADAWREWTRLRGVLQVEPVPVVPPGLLLRILIVCRLQSLAGRKTKPQRHDAGLTVPTLPMATLPLAAWDIIPGEEMPTTREAISAAREFVPPPPTNMVDEILRRTVGAAAPQELELPVMAAPPAVARITSPAIAPIAISPRRRPWLQLNRLMTASVVPAFMVLVAFIFQAEQGNAPSRLIDSDGASLPQITADAGAPVKARAHSNVNRSVRRTTALAAEAPDDAAIAPMAISGGADTDDNTVAEAVDSATRVASSHEPLTIAASVARPAIATSLVMPVKGRAAYDAPDMSRARSVTLAMVSGPSDAALLSSRLPLRSVRVTMPKAEALVAGPVNATVSAGDPVTEEVGYSPDYRPEAVRGIVDEYRATLIEDAEDGETTS